MSRTFTQKEIGDFLSANPYGFAVHVGDLPNLNGQNYICFDYLGETLVPSDNQGCYKTTLQIAIYSNEFSLRKKITDYIKGLTQFSIEYQGSDDGNYFVALLQSEIFIQ